MELEEKHMDAVTAVSGNGPAYLFYLVESMAAGAIAVGLPPDLAVELSAQTFFGASRLLMDTGEEPAVLRKRVTSPGGTTEAAFKVLIGHDLEKIFVEAIENATKRAQELGSMHS